MRFRGRVWKNGNFWLIDIPMLDATTQGRTKKEAYEMIVDLIETMANRSGFEVTINSFRKDCFELSSNDAKTLVALLLKRQRQKNGLSLADMTRRLGAKSRNAYARYEQGTSVPSVEKLDELLKAVSPENELVLAQTGTE
jgi:predicted transcriptional regulator